MQRAKNYTTAPLKTNRTRAHAIHTTFPTLASVNSQHHLSAVTITCTYSLGLEGGRVGDPCRDEQWCWQDPVSSQERRIMLWKWRWLCKRSRIVSPLATWVSSTHCIPLLLTREKTGQTIQAEAELKRVSENWVISTRIIEKTFYPGCENKMYCICWVCFWWTM